MEKESLPIGIQDQSEMMFDYQTNKNWQDVCDPKMQHWKSKYGFLISSELEKFGDDFRGI